jgi:hypothetical protein
MFRDKIKEYSSYDLIEDLKLISQELNSRFDKDETGKDLTDLIKTISNKLLVKVS